MVDGGAMKRCSWTDLQFLPNEHVAIIDHDYRLPSPQACTAKMKMYKDYQIYDKQKIYINMVHWIQQNN